MPSLHRRRFLQLSALAGVGVPGPTDIAAAGAETAPGDAEWTSEIGDAVSSSPTIVDGTVFVGSYDGHVYALDADTGDEEWSFDAGAIVWSSPAVVDGTVFVGTRQNTHREEDEIVFGDGHVFAIDAESGEELWTFTVESGFRSSPTVLDGTVYVGSYYDVTRDREAGGALRAIDADSGEEEWAFDAPYPVRSSPSIVDDTVYVQSGANFPYLEGALVHAIDADTGEQEWKFDVGHDRVTSPTAAGGTVYAVGDAIYAIDTDEGRKEWTFDAGLRFPTTPTVADGILYIGGREGLVAIDTGDAEERWRFEPDMGVDSSPTVAGGFVFIAVPQSYRPSGHEAIMEESEVYALDAATGDVEWKFENDADEADFDSAPTVVDGTLYIGCLDTNVYALDAGVDGSSEGSRVKLGTLGHHHTWAERAGTKQGHSPLPNGEALLGAAGALAGLGTGGYLLNRWHADS